MSRKKEVVLVVMVFLILLGGIIFLLNNDNNTVEIDTITFKNEYESLNNKKNKNNLKYPTVNVIEDIDIVYKTTKESIDIIKNETGVLYFGFPECPWCRNALPVLFEVLKDRSIATLYYINMKDERDVIEVVNNKLVYAKDEYDNELTGTKDYFKLLDLLDEYLEEYKVYDQNGKEYDTEEKRIYVPLIVFVKEGKIVGTHLSTVETHESGYDKMTEEEKEKLYDIYDDFAKELYSNTCSINSGC